MKVALIIFLVAFLIGIQIKRVVVFAYARRTRNRLIAAGVPSTIAMLITFAVFKRNADGSESAATIEVQKMILILKGRTYRLSLKLSLLSKSEWTDERERWPFLSMAIRNKGEKVWYISRDAELHGLDIEVRDHNGKLLERNRHGMELAKPKPTFTWHRGQGVPPEEPVEFIIALGEMYNLVPGETYKVRVTWTLSMYETFDDRERGATAIITSNRFRFVFSEPGHHQ